MPIGDGVESRLGERGSRPSCCSGRWVSKKADSDGIEVEARYVMQ